MRRFSVAAAMVAAVMVFVLSTAVAGGKTYQFTGKVLEVRDNAIVVEKESGGKKERFEMARDASTKVRGDLQIGAKVTIQYESRAVEIEVKAK